MAKGNLVVIFLLYLRSWQIHAAVNCKETGPGRHGDLADVTCKNYTLCIYVKVSKSYLSYSTMCPTTSVFDPTVGTCTSNKTYSCDRQPRSPPVTPVTEKSAPQKSICTIDGYIPDVNSQNCTTYLQCVQIAGVFTKIMYTCPNVTYFNPTTTMCEADYKCSTDFICLFPGRFSNEKDRSCQKYFSCVLLSNGKYAMFNYSCPGGSMFNPETQLCTTQYKCNL